MESARTLTTAVHQEEDWWIDQCLEIDVASQGRSLSEAVGQLIRGGIALPA